MLWYKAWLETRARFLICFVGIAALSGWNVYRMDESASNVNLAYYYSVLHTSHSQLVLTWLLAVNFMTMGGLLREKAVGAASFTLSLPVGRARLMAIRIAVSLIENLSLIVGPSIVIFVIGTLAGKTHSVSQALFHVVLMAGGGLVYYAIALLACSVVEGEYTAPIVSFGIVILIASTFDSPPFRAYNPLYFMSGSRYYDSHAGLLRGPVPWAQLGIYAAVAACLMLVSAKALEARDF